MAPTVATWRRDARGRDSRRRSPGSAARALVRGALVVASGGAAVRSPARAPASAMRDAVAAPGSGDCAVASRRSSAVSAIARGRWRRGRTRSRRGVQAIGRLRARHLARGGHGRARTASSCSSTWSWCCGQGWCSRRRGGLVAAVAASTGYLSLGAIAGARLPASRGSRPSRRGTGHGALQPGLLVSFLVALGARCRRRSASRARRTRQTLARASREARARAPRHRS